MRPSSRSPNDLAETLDSVLTGVPDAGPVIGALARTIRSNLPQQREHPSHEVLVDDWAHGYALRQNRRLSHALKQAVLAVARRLDDAGLGRLRLGRRGKKTRFSLPPSELTAWLEAMSAFSGRSDAPTPLALATPSADRPAGPPAAPPQDDQRTVSERGPPRPTRAERPDPPEGTPPSGIDRLEHRFVVRPGVVVRFSLPADFSAVEARRLARFVTALPFEGSDE